jgi:hypothetical protein
MERVLRKVWFPQVSIEFDVQKHFARFSQVSSLDAFQTEVVVHQILNIRQLNEVKSPTCPGVLIKHTMNQCEKEFSHPQHFSPACTPELAEIRCNADMPLKYSMLTDHTGGSTCLRTALGLSRPRTRQEPIERQLFLRMEEVAPGSTAEIGFTGGRPVHALLSPKANGFTWRDWEQIHNDG